MTKDLRNKNIMEDKIIKLRGIVVIANSLSSVTLEHISNSGDYFDEIDTDLRKVLSQKAHQLVDDMGIEAKG